MLNWKIRHEYYIQQDDERGYAVLIENDDGKSDKQHPFKMVIILVKV